MAIHLESLSSTGENGTNRDTKKSNPQKSVMDVTKELIDETIEEKLEITLASISNTICLADLGCSTGPNTFYSMQNILEAMKQKLVSSGGLASPDQLPDFQIFFNDLSFNDFNSLFKFLPPERRYFAAGVPGSFFHRLFPRSSLHFVHCSYALQWLSQVPDEVLDKDSPAWNRGRIHYAGAPEAVVAAFSAQFAEDMRMFLEARAKEVVEGGMMVLIMPSIPDEVPCSLTPTGILFNHLGSCLLDMAKEELLREDLVDLFNIPLYAPSPSEMQELIEENGCFSIERMESTGCICEPNSKPTGSTIIMYFRAGMEGIINRHFGDEEIADELFDRMTQRSDELLNLLASSVGEGSQLTVILKRRCHL